MIFKPRRRAILVIGVSLAAGVILVIGFAAAAVYAWGMPYTYTAVLFPDGYGYTLRYNSWTGDRCAFPEVDKKGNEHLPAGWRACEPSLLESL